MPALPTSSPWLALALSATARFGAVIARPGAKSPSHQRLAHIIQERAAYAALAFHEGDKGGDRHEARMIRRVLRESAAVVAPLP